MAEKVKITFERSHPRYGYWPGNDAEVSAEEAKELIDGGFARKHSAKDEKAAEVQTPPAPAVAVAPTVPTASTHKATVKKAK